MSVKTLLLNWKRSRTGQGHSARSALNDVLLIDVRSNSVVLVETSRREKSTETGRAIECQLPAGLLESDEPSRAGTWLRDQLSRNAIAARHCILSLPRAMTAFRALTLPAASIDEVNRLVALQAELQSMAPIDSLCWSYIRSSEPPGAPDIHPLMMTAGRNRVEPWVRMLESAGLHLVSALPRAVLLAAAAPRVHPEAAPGSAVWLVAQAGEQIELVISTPNGELLGSQSVPRSDASDPSTHARVAAAIVAKINQTRAAIPNGEGHHSRSVFRLAIEKNLAEALGEVLQRDVGVDSHRIQNVAWPEDAADSISSLVGSGCRALLEQDGTVPDLWRPPSCESERPRSWLKAAALAVALSALVGWSVLRTRTSLDLEMKQLVQEQRQLARFIERGEALQPLADYLDQWSQHQVSAREELAAFLGRLPPERRMILDELALSADAGGRLQLRVKGAAESPDAILSLNRELLSVPSRYRVQPHPLTVSRRHAGFPTGFEIEAEIVVENGVENDVENDVTPTTVDQAADVRRAGDPGSTAHQVPRSSVASSESPGSER